MGGYKEVHACKVLNDLKEKRLFLIGYKYGKTFQDQSTIRYSNNQALL